jgi:hypothetical protein
MKERKVTIPKSKNISKRNHNRKRILFEYKPFGKDISLEKNIKQFKKRKSKLEQWILIKFKRPHNNWTKYNNLNNQVNC